MHRHVEVFLDESGDLGFSSRSSKHLVVIALATEEPYRLSRIVRRARRKVSMSREAGPEFKFNRSGEQLRRFFLEGICESGSSIVWGAASKSGAVRRSITDKTSFWQYVTVRTVSALAGTVHSRSMRLTIDRLSPRPNVARSLASRLVDEVRIHHVGYFPPSVEVRLIDSRGSEELQVADYVAGAVYQSVERQNPSYLGLLEDSFIHGEVYW